MKSMTGFGASEYRRPTFELRVAIRAVNGRFLDTRFHLPREYASLEAELKKLVQKHVRRGVLEVYVHRRAAHRGAMQIHFHEDIAEEWLKAYHRLNKALKLRPIEWSAREIVSLPRVFEVSDAPAPLAKEKPVLMKLMRQALAKLDQQRAREGRVLQRECAGFVKQLQSIVARMARIQNEAQKELQRRLEQRISDLKLDHAVDPQRLAVEVGLLVEKSDITEEIVRLREHLRVCSQIIRSPRPEGKRLEFYIQELLRESNTIGSKSHVSELTACVVEAKTLVERLKEQVQNIE